MSKTMIGSCSSAGRNLKIKRSSAAGKTLATTCKTKKAAAKTTAAKPVVKKAAPKPVVKKAAPKPVVKKAAPKRAVKKSVVMVKPKTVKTTTPKKEVIKHIPYGESVITWRDFNEYARKRIQQYPDLKQDIVDIYYLAKEEIEDGHSEQNEVSLGYRSIEDLIKGILY
jgi:hypothetical protein